MNTTEWPKTEDELLDRIRQNTINPWEGISVGGEGAGDAYGRTMEQLSQITLDAFHYGCSVLHVSGLQASWAELNFVAKARQMEHGFLLLDADNLLYPQYDLLAQVREWIAETRPHLAKVAREKLAESPTAHPEVLARWREIAALDTEEAS
jgi:hypothetical protein